MYTLSCTEHYNEQKHIYYDTRKRAPKSWVLLGSNDEVNWHEIDKKENIFWDISYFKRKRFDVFSNTQSYIYYRLCINKTMGHTFVALCYIHLRGLHGNQLLEI
jgi:hypothetical protein